MKSKDQYFTHPTVADKLSTVVTKYIGDVSGEYKVLEPAAGSGNLINSLRKIMPNIIVSAYEIDAVLCEKYDWTCKDFLTIAPPKTEDEMFDFVIANPPFRSARKEKQNQSNYGKNLMSAFLAHASKFSKRLFFILHQSTAYFGFTQKLYQLQPRLHLEEFIPINKNDGKFLVAGKWKKIPCAIAVYTVLDEGQQTTPPRTFEKSYVCDDFEIVELNDDRCNLIVKRWGSPSRVGRIVDNTTPEKEYSKERKQYKRGQGVNLHLYCHDVKLVKKVITGKMESVLNHTFRNMMGCDNIVLMPYHFRGLYLDAKKE